MRGGSPVKRCSLCKENLPRDAFGLHRGKRGGLQTYCRPCQNARVRAARDARMVESACPACGIVRKIDPHNSSPDMVCGRCQRVAAANTNRGLRSEELQRRAATNALARSKKLTTKLLKLHVERASRIPQLLRRYCEWCGSEFRSSQPATKNCSRWCYKRNSTARSEQRKGRFAPAPSLRSFVHERDAWVCWICDTSALPWGSTDAVWHPEYATLDHVQPRSLGGSDDEENLKTAHALCNSLRGADQEWDEVAAA